MNAQKILIAAVAGGITLFATGYIIYVLIFGASSIGLTDGASSVLLPSDQVKFSGIIAMELLYGLLIAATLNWKGGSGFGSGLIPGALLGLLIGFTFGLDLYSTTHLVDFNYVIFSGLTYGVRFCLAGGVVALVLGGKQK